jgi:hypothetical protein
VVWGRAVQDDKQFRVSGNWALASDGIQCIIQKWAGNKWRGVKFIRSDKAWLAYRLTTVGVPDADAARLLDGLPDAFAAWLEAVHDVFGARGLPKPPETARTNRACREVTLVALSVLCMPVPSAITMKP